MATNGESKRRDSAQQEPNGEAWRLTDKAFRQIAPRRSAVRARLAPLHERPARAGLSASLRPPAARTRGRRGNRMATLARALSSESGGPALPWRRPPAGSARPD